jgi:hypothetical protein
MWVSAVFTTACLMRCLILSNANGLSLFGTTLRLASARTGSLHRPGAARVAGLAVSPFCERAFVSARAAPSGSRSPGRRG